MKRRRIEDKTLEETALNHMNTHWHCRWKLEGQRSQHSRLPPSSQASQ